MLLCGVASIFLNYLFLQVLVDCLFGMDVEFINSDYEVQVNVIMAVCMLMFNMCYFGYKRYKYNSHPFHFLKTLVIPGLVIIVFSLSYFIKMRYFDAKYSLSISVLLYIVLSILFYKLCDVIVKISQIKFENKLLKNQTEYYINKQFVLEENYNAIREVKHNLKHTLLYMHNKLNTGNIEELETELALMIEQVEDKQVSYTSNPSVNFLLNYKLDSFRESGIDIDIKVDIGKDTSLDEKILYVVLGNILDNALENYNSNCALQKSVCMRITEDGGNLYIKVSNPYLHDITIKNGLPKSTKNDVVSHGIGLKSVKEILTKNKGNMKINTENNIFTITVIIFDGAKPRIH